MLRGSLLAAALPPASRVRERNRARAQRPDRVLAPGRERQPLSDLQHERGGDTATPTDEQPQVQQPVPGLLAEWPKDRFRQLPQAERPLADALRRQPQAAADPNSRHRRDRSRLVAGRQGDRLRCHPAGQTARNLDHRGRRHPAATADEPTPTPPGRPMAARSPSIAGTRRRRSSTSSSSRPTAERRRISAPIRESLTSSRTGRRTGAESSSPATDPTRSSSTSGR